MDNYIDTKYSQIGSFVKIGNYTTIGTPGFKIYKSGHEMYREAHEFKAIIEDFVDLGEMNVVHRGRWRDTIVGRWTHTDSRVHISHNVQIGERCIIGPNVTILGSCTIGDNVEIWTGAIIHQHVKIGDNVIIGANSYIRHDVPDNFICYGSPAKVVRKNE